MKTISTMNLEVTRRVLKKLASNTEITILDEMHNRNRKVFISSETQKGLEEALTLIEVIQGTGEKKVEGHKF